MEEEEREEEVVRGGVERSGKACSSYVANGVAKFDANGLGGVGSDEADPALLCSFAWRGSAREPMEAVLELGAVMLGSMLRRSDRDSFDRMGGERAAPALDASPKVKVEDLIEGVGWYDEVVAVAVADDDDNGEVRWFWWLLGLLLLNEAEK